MDVIIEQLSNAWSACERNCDLQSGQSGDELLSILEKRWHLQSIQIASSAHCVLHRIAREQLPVVKTNQNIVLAVIRPEDASAQHLAEAYREFKQSLPSGMVAFAFIILAADEFRALSKTSLTPIVVLSKAIALKLVSGEVRPQICLKEQLSEQVSLEDLNPYEAAGPVKPAMFYGRENELKRILSPHNKGLGVIGQRGIGKSSLLIEAHRRATEEGSYVSVYVDAQTYKRPEQLKDELFKRLLPQEHHKGREFELDEVISRAAGSKMILLLLDEMDNVTRKCEQMDDWSLFKWLQTGASREQSRTVMTGWRDFRLGMLSRNHRLFNFFDREQLGILDLKDTRRLIVEPLTDLGIGFADLEGTVNRITNWSSGHPAYIQLYCYKLVKHLHQQETNSRRIAPADLDAIENDPTVYEYVVSSFIHDTPALEKCVAYAILDRNSFDEKDVADALRKLGLNPGMNSLLKACDNLAVANVFWREHHGYRFLFSGFCKAIREHYPVERMLASFIEEARTTQVSV
jgi:hypothetical protein